LFSAPRPPRPLHSFPTRRSSDLGSTVEPTLDDALAADPDNVALLVERARLLARATHYRAAQRDYERALRVDPIHGEALRGLGVRSEEHTSELQSLAYLVCRLLLE